METGPFRLAPGSKGELVEAEGAWNEYANVVFSELPREPKMGCVPRANESDAVDQPVGTGYSYAATNKYVHELKDVSIGSNGLAAHVTR